MWHAPRCRYCARYRIDDVSMHAEVLSAYAQHLPGALQETRTKPSDKLVKMLVAMTQSCEELADALFVAQPPLCVAPIRIPAHTHSHAHSHTLAVQ